MKNNHKIFFYILLGIALLAFVLNFILNPIKRRPESSVEPNTINQASLNIILPDSITDPMQGKAQTIYIEPFRHLFKKNSPSSITATCKFKAKGKNFYDLHIQLELEKTYENTFYLCDAKFAPSPSSDTLFLAISEEKCPLFSGRLSNERILKNKNIVVKVNNQTTITRPFFPKICNNILH